MNPKLRLMDWMVIDFTRYGIGRRPYQVFTICDWLIAHWSHLDDSVRSVIRRDLEEAFRRDDAHRAGLDDSLYRPLRDDIDRAEWDKVRKLWQEPTSEA